MANARTKFPAASKDGTKVPSTRRGRPGGGGGGTRAKKSTPRPKNRSSSSSSGGGGGMVIRRGGKREIVFDPEARRAHLRGFSERKRQRRAFGLAMQKVKDRTAKIDQRAQERKDDLARVEEAERQKREVMMATDDDGNDDDDPGEIGDDRDDDDDAEEVIEEEDKASFNDAANAEMETKKNDVIDTKVYDDRKTESTWGGQVTVTTSIVQLGNDDSDDELPNEKTKGSGSGKKSIDVAQRYAGNVQKYLDAFKGRMPSKKRDSGGPKAKRKGRNGAADMQGMGGAANLKVAQKLLRKSKDSNKRTVGGSGGKKGKIGKRR
jgi:Nucleolar protein 12 (25kDa)